MDKIFLPAWFDERSFEKLSFGIDVSWWRMWNRWAEENIWANGIGTWGFLDRGEHPQPMWTCRACNVGKVEQRKITTVAQLVRHLNSKKHREALVLVKLSGEDPRHLA